MLAGSNTRALAFWLSGAWMAHCNSSGERGNAALRAGRIPGHLLRLGGGVDDAL